MFPPPLCYFVFGKLDYNNEQRNLLDAKNILVMQFTSVLKFKFSTEVTYTQQEAKDENDVFETPLMSELTGRMSCYFKINSL